MSKAEECTIVDSTRQVLRCTRCGDEVPMPLGLIDWVVAYMKAFGKAHQRCIEEPDPGSTRVSVLRSVWAPRSKGARSRKAGAK